MATSVPFDTERFHLALQLRQETKAGLGSALGVSRQFVHQIATGTRTPTREFVLGLARHLAVSPRFFEEALPDKLAEHMTHFRALKSTSKRRRDSAKAYAQILDLLVAQVIDRVEVPPVDIPSYVANTVADAERAAEGARRYWDLTVNGPIASVVRVLEHAGAITTALYGLATKIDAFSCQGLTRPLVVVVGDRGTATRRRMTLAHEIGHLIMHQGASEYTDDLEEQANRFASAFLLPRSAFLTEFPAKKWLDWTGLFRMKARWGVSVKAIVRRAFELECIDYRLYRRANIHIGSKGWQKGEPHEPEFEQPELLPGVVDALGSGGELTRQEIAATLGLHEHDVRAVLGERKAVPPNAELVPFDATGGGA